MDTIAHFKRLFAYDDWANREVLNALKSADVPPARSIKLLAHIFGAERIWFDRMQSAPQSVPVWPEFTLQQCEAQARELPKLWKQFLASMSEADFARTFDYKNSKGERWTSRPDDVLMHVIMHSAYHRGQIAADMRAAGITPAYTDYIHGVRQGLVE